jgi:hypothetical protein
MADVIQQAAMLFAKRWCYSTRRDVIQHASVHNKLGSTRGERMSNANSGGKQLVARSFDLTTSVGLTEALRAAKDPDLLLLIGGPIPYLAKKLFDKGAELIRETANSTNSTIQEQRQAAVDIIKAGKDNNASSLEVTLDQKAGINLGSEIEGIPLKFSVGKSGKMTIKVEYK